MPMVKSGDPGNKNGMIHSHRFPAANMAVATANEDTAQMKATEDFLKSGFISVDIFAASAVTETKAEMRRRASELALDMMRRPDKSIAEVFVR